jgi:hypothetical protein
MPADERFVAISAEQAKSLEELVIPALLRSGDTEVASQMMTLALKYKFGESLPSKLDALAWPTLTVIAGGRDDA